jgi:hypothetical protein
LSLFINVLTPISHATAASIRPYQIFAFDLNTAWVPSKAVGSLSVGYESQSNENETTFMHATGFVCVSYFTTLWWRWRERNGRIIGEGKPMSYRTGTTVHPKYRPLCPSTRLVV